MSWLVMLLFVLIVGHGFGSYLRKKIVGLPSRTRRFCWQFFFCLIASAAFALWGDQYQYWLLSAFPVCLIMGIMNGLANYCLWRSEDINLSKAAIFTQGDDIIAMLLAMFLLNEKALVDLSLGLSILACLSAGLILYMAGRGNTRMSENRALVLWVGAFSVLWGIALFLERYAAVNAVPPSQYIVLWYLGSWATSLVILVTAGTTERGAPLSRQGLLGTFALSLTMWPALYMGYLMIQRVPLVVLNPVYQVSQLLFPLFIGLFVFKETRELTKTDLVAYTIGTIGAVAIAIRF